MRASVDCRITSINSNYLGLGFFRSRFWSCELMKVEGISGVQLPWWRVGDACVACHSGCIERRAPGRAERTYWSLERGARKMAARVMCIRAAPTRQRHFLTLPTHWFLCASSSSDISYLASCAPLRLQRFASRSNGVDLNDGRLLQRYTFMPRIRKDENRCTLGGGSGKRGRLYVRGVWNGFGGNKINCKPCFLVYLQWSWISGSQMLFRFSKKDKR